MSAAAHAVRPPRRHVRPPTLRAGALAVAMLFSTAARGGPAGPVVASGQVQVSRPNAQTTVITQGSPKAILNWNSFDVAAGELVDFRQPSAASVILNRVGGGQASTIAGRISANGQVFLVNPEGVLFGSGARVDVGSLVASTLAITDQDFLAGRYVFEGGSPYYSSVVNQGSLSAAERGTVALLGGQVRNDGTITARLGTIGLAGGGKVTLDFAGDGLTRITVGADAFNALVANGGALIADGGDIVMSIAAANAFSSAVLQNTGVVRARSLVERNGRILLDGGSLGAVEVGGTLDASAPVAFIDPAPLNGGKIQINGGDVRVGEGASIDASGDSGGVVRVGGPATRYDTLTDAFRGGGYAQTITIDAGAVINVEATRVPPPPPPAETPYDYRPGNGGSIALGSRQNAAVFGTLRANGRDGGAGGTIIVASGAIDVEGLHNQADPLYRGNLVLRQANFDVDANLAGLISASLANGTSVTLDATPPASPLTGTPESGGNINVGSSIGSNGGYANLTLAAAQDIVIAPSVSIAASGYAPMNVDLNANSGNGGDGGSIYLAPGSGIFSNGGNVRLFGQSDPFNGAARGNSNRQADGVRIDNATIDTRLVSPVDYPSTNGSIAIAGAGAAGYGSGVAIRNSEGASIVANDSVQIRSDGGGTVVQLYGGQLAARTGDLRIQAVDGGGAQVTLSDGAVMRAGGAIDIDASRGPGWFSEGGIAPAVDLQLFDAVVESGGTLRISGSAGEGNGIGGRMFRSRIAAGSGNLVLSGSAGAGGTGVAIKMADSTISATNGDLRIVGTGNLDGIAGVVIGSDFDDENGGIVSGASGSGGVVTDSTARLLASGGNLIVSGTASPSLLYDGEVAVGTRLTGLSLQAVDGAVRLDGLVGVAGAGGVPAREGLWLRDSIVATSGSNPGAISLRGVTAASAPGLRLDGVSVGGAGQRGDIVLGAGNGGGAPMLGYRSESVFANAVQTSGAVNVRAEDLGSGVNGAAADVAITVSDSATGASGLVISPAALGIGGAGPARLVIGSAEHRGAIGYSLGRTWSGDLTLQNGGAGSAGIDIASDLQASGALTLSSGGTVSQQGGTRINAPSLLLNGTRPESNFQLMGPNNSTPRFAAVFNVPKSLADAAHGDVNYTSSGDVSVTALQGIGFATPGFDYPAGQTISAAGGTVVAGDLLLRAGGRLTLQQDVRTIGSDITLVAGSMFDNSGGHALTPGADGNWRVFADTWRGEARGGLQPSRPVPNVYDCTYGASCGNLAGNHFIYREQPALTLQADPQSRMYGDANPVFTYTVTGLINGDLASDAASGAYSSPAGAASNAGSYAIDGSYTSPAGYALTANPGTLTVTRAPLAIGADDQRKVYGGADPRLTSSTSGLRNGDTLAQLGLAPVLNTATGKAAGAGLHPIGIEGVAGTTNYDISYHPGTLTVDRAQLLVTADDQRKVYGATDPTLSASYSGFQYDDSAAVVDGLRLQTAVGAAATAGSHPITGSGAAAANYVVSYRSGSLSVDRAPLLVLADDQAKVYGAADPLLTASYSGFQYNDTAGTLGSVLLQTATGAAATAGNHPIALAGGAAPNYAVSYRPGTLTVAKAPLLVSADDQSKVYGAPDPLLTASYSGLQYDDTAGVLTGLRLQTAVGAAAGAGRHPITPGGAAAANYEVLYRGGTLTVARAPLSVAANDQSKVYGAADPALTASYSGFQYGDDAGVLANLRLSTDTGAAAGVGAHPIGAGGAVASNYAVNYRAGTLNVTPAALTITANDAATRYGEAAPVLTARYDGLVYGETPAVVSGLTLNTPLSAGTALAALAPGDYPIVPASASAANYAISYVNGALRVGASPIALRPVIARDVTFESSYLYEKNVGTPRMCVGTGPLAAGGSAGGADMLGLDWSRVRVSPNLSNCLALGQRNSCSDF